jgi:hypothetical protein
MKIIITENRLTNLINKTLGYDLSDKIVRITNFRECLLYSCYRFESIGGFNNVLEWGSMYCFFTPKHGNWLVQKRDGGEWFIGQKKYVDTNRIRIDEFTLLSYMGISMFGIPLDVIIDNFVKEK